MPFFSRLVRSCIPSSPSSSALLDNDEIQKSSSSAYHAEATDDRSRSRKDLHSHLGRSARVGLVRIRAFLTSGKSRPHRYSSLSASLDERGSRAAREAHRDHQSQAQAWTATLSTSTRGLGRSPSPSVESEKGTLGAAQSSESSNGCTGLNKPLPSIPSLEGPEPERHTRGTSRTACTTLVNKNILKVPSASAPAAPAQEQPRTKSRLPRLTPNHPGLYSAIATRTYISDARRGRTSLRWAEEVRFVLPDTGRMSDAVLRRAHQHAVGCSSTHSVQGASILRKVPVPAVVGGPEKERGLAGFRVGFNVRRLFGRGPREKSTVEKEAKVHHTPTPTRITPKSESPQSASASASANANYDSANLEPQHEIRPWPLNASSYIPLKRAYWRKAQHQFPAPPNRPICHHTFQPSTPTRLRPLVEKIVRDRASAAGGRKKAAMAVIEQEALVELLIELGHGDSESESESEGESGYED